MRKKKSVAIVRVKRQVKPHVLVIVRGGCVQGVLPDRDMHVTLIDWDNIVAGGGINKYESVTSRKAEIENIIRLTEEQINKRGAYGRGA